MVVSKPMPRDHWIHSYVPISIAMDYVLLGWLPLTTLAGTPHGRWSVHMAWICDCAVPRAHADEHRIIDDALAKLGGGGV